MTTHNTPSVSQAKSINHQVTERSHYWTGTASATFRPDSMYPQGWSDRDTAIAFPAHEFMVGNHTTLHSFRNVEVDGFTWTELRFVDAHGTATLVRLVGWNRDDLAREIMTAKEFKYGEL